MYRNRKGNDRMIVDRRNSDRCGVVLSPHERQSIFKEAGVFDFHLPEIAGNFLPHDPYNTVLHIYKVDGNLSLTIVNRQGKHSWIRNPRELLHALTNEYMKYSVKPEVMETLSYKAHTIHRLLKHKLVTSHAESTQVAEAV